MKKLSKSIKSEFLLQDVTGKIFTTTLWYFFILNNVLQQICNYISASQDGGNKANWLALGKGHGQEELS